MAEALLAIELKILQESQFISASLGSIGVTVATAAGAKNAKNDWYDFVPANLKSLTQPKERSGISKKTAQVFAKLLREGKIPSWVLNFVDAKAIVEVAKNG